MNDIQESNVDLLIIKMQRDLIKRFVMHKMDKK